MQQHFRFTFLFLLLLSVLFLTGCGPTKYPVTGTVNYDGQPLAKGVLTLTPDGTKDNRGTSSYADITNGTFTVPAKFGVGGGAYRVYVESSEPDSSDPEGGATKENFRTFSMNHDFSAGQKNYTLDINIPKGGGAAK